MIYFIHGKGGVGRSTVAEALSRRLTQNGLSVRWYQLHEHRNPTPFFEEQGPHLSRSRLSAQSAFEEYMSLLLKSPWIGKVFAQNRLIQYLAEAAPGIHEIVLLGKIWHERNETSHQVVDLPSSGYARAMFQSIRNFSRLFEGGAVHRDALKMLETFSNPSEAEHWIVAIPEELTMNEGYEHGLGLASTLPGLKLRWLLNQCLPSLNEGSRALSSAPRLIASTREEALLERRQREVRAREAWRRHSIQWSEWPWTPGPQLERTQALAERGQHP